MTTQGQQEGNKNSPFRVCITDEPGRRYPLLTSDPILSEVLSREVLQTNNDDTIEFTVKEFARVLNKVSQHKTYLHFQAAEEIPTPPSRENKSSSNNNNNNSSSVGSSRCSSSRSSTSEECKSPLITTTECKYGWPQGSIEAALSNSITTNSSLFFRLTQEAYEISRNPFGANRGDIWRWESHCPAFKLCVKLFQRIYDKNVRPKAEEMIPFDCNLKTIDNLLSFRSAVRESYNLHEEEPSSSGRSESNLDSKWVSQILNDKYFFPDAATRSVPQSGSHTDVTLSYVRRPTDSTNKENEMQTYYLTKMLENPTWDPDESEVNCRECHRAYKSVSRPLGVRGHHCRCCGRRLCSFCITHKAHRSFAKLSKPGQSMEEGDERLVCDSCHASYIELERLRYLGALLAFSGLDFAHLSLCRTINSQWRNASELCLSEYRLLLHTCECDLVSVLSPIGVLLQNSVRLIIGSAASASKFPKKAPPSVHTEAALLLLKYIERENLWGQPFVAEFVRLLGQCSLKGRPAFSHWHFFCTSCCGRMKPCFFLTRAMRSLSHASMMEHHYVADTMQRMCSLLLKECGVDGDGTSTPLDTHRKNRETCEYVVLVLLDMLYKDALIREHTKRQYQYLLEKLLPTLATNDVYLAFMMICSLQSTDPHLGYDEEFLGAWRTRLWEEVGFDGQHQRRATAEATMEFFRQLDAFCLQSADRRSSSVVSWIWSYCRKALSSSTDHSSDGSGSGAGRIEPIVDLPHPIFNPFNPKLELRSVVLSGVQVESSSTRPVWLKFSTLTNAQRKEQEQKQNEQQEQDIPSSFPLAPSSSSPTPNTEEVLCSILYKCENAEKDQLMCISSRLIQLLLKAEIGSAQMTNYSVLPLSYQSALIEKADGFVLCKLPGMHGHADISTFVQQRGESAQKNFLASAKLFLLLNYIFSIGDRHQGNVMMSATTGAIWHIDFGFIFSEKTLVEKLAGSSLRVDNEFLAAVASCRRAIAAAENDKGGRRRGSATSNSSAAATMDNEGFFKEAAEWFLAVRPHAELFNQLCLYGVHRGVLRFNDRDMASVFNTLFDRSASRTGSADNFANTMKNSINVCRLHDVTHSSVQALRSYADDFTRRLSEGGVDAMKSIGMYLRGWSPLK